MSDLKSFDRVAGVYDATRALPDDAAEAIAARIAEALFTLGGAPRLLEVGIGTGRMAAPLADRGVRITGVDIAPRMLALLRAKRPGIDALLAEASRLPFVGASFDAALFVHILHLVPDAGATVRAALRAVRSGGLLISGGDDHANNIREQADAIIRRAAFDLAGVRMRGWQPYDEGARVFADVTREAGAQLEHVVAARWTGQASARGILARLARRDFSSSWLIPDDTLPAVIGRAAPAIERLFGGLDREVPVERSFSLTFARMA